MFEVKFEGVFPILQLLSIIGVKGWTVEVVADSFGFISDFVAFSANSKAKVGVVLAGQVFIPSASLLNNSFFKQQIHGGNAPSVFANALVAVFEFVTDAFCPWVISVPGFYAAANSCNFRLLQVRHK